MDSLILQVLAKNGARDFVSDVHRLVPIMATYPLVLCIVRVEKNFGMDAQLDTGSTAYFDVIQMNLNLGASIGITFGFPVGFCLTSLIVSPFASIWLLFSLLVWLIFWRLFCFPFGFPWLIFQLLFRSRFFYKSLDLLNHQLSAYFFFAIF